MKIVVFFVVVLVVAICMSGCGTIGYRLKRGTGDNGKVKGEVYWNVIEIDFKK